MKRGLIDVCDVVVTDVKTGEEIMKTTRSSENHMAKFLEHQQSCEKCPDSGSIVDPDPDDYCEEGFELLKNMIEQMQNMTKLLFG